MSRRSISTSRSMCGIFSVAEGVRILTDGDATVVTIPAADLGRELESMLTATPVSRGQPELVKKKKEARARPLRAAPAAGAGQGGRPRQRKRPPPRRKQRRRSKPCCIGPWVAHEDRHRARQPGQEVRTHRHNAGFSGGRSTCQGPAFLICPRRSITPWSAEGWPGVWRSFSPNPRPS